MATPHPQGQAANMYTAAATSRLYPQQPAPSIVTVLHGLPHPRHPGSHAAHVLRPLMFITGSARLPAPLRFPSPQAAATPPPSSGPLAFILGAPIRTRGCASHLAAAWPDPPQCIHDPAPSHSEWNPEPHFPVPSPKQPASFLFPPWRGGGRFPACSRLLAPPVSHGLGMHLDPAYPFPASLCTACM